jgi:glycerophosphoryl diester phosphodiesterase
MRQLAYMASRLPSLRTVPIGFAHRGGRAHAPDNTLEAFALGLRLGASGLETDAWLTADGEVALDHDGIVGRVRRRSIGELTRGELPSHIPTLAELYAECGTDFELSIDVKDADAAAAIVATAREAGDGAVGRVWLCHHDWEQVATWRDLSPDVRLVDSTRLRRMKGGPERRAAVLADAGVDAVNLHQSDWTGGLTTLFHRFERTCLGWDAQYPRVLAGLLHMGIDGVFSDHVDLMVEAIRTATEP